MPERLCRECKRPESEELEFKGSGKICVECRAEYMREYRRKNREKLSAQVQDWKDENREHYREKNREYYSTPEGKAKALARVEKTPRTWIGHIFSGTKKRINNPGRHDKKDGPARVLEIDIDYVLNLYKAQDGKCALTGLKMTHQFNDHFAISIDRVDSEVGYIPGNVQLVCQAVNLAKRHHSNESILTFFDAFFMQRCRDAFIDTGN